MTIDAKRQTLLRDTHRLTVAARRAEQDIKRPEADRQAIARHLNEAVRLMLEDEE